MRNPRAGCYIHLLQPLTITHVDSGTAWRGGQQSVLTLALALRERGHVQTLVCPADSALAARARAAGLAVASRCSRQSDVVHAHSGRAQNLAYWQTLGTGMRRVVTRHVAFPPRSPFLHRLKYSWTCDGIIAVSAAVRDVLVSAGVPAVKIEVIHTGIQLPDALPTADQRAAARRSLGVPADAFCVGQMGAFTTEKGHDVTVAAAALLQNSLPAARFLLAGDGPLAATLRASAPAGIQFPGFVQDLDSFFAALDLFLMPSRSEAWGLAALEAMAHGVPVIGSDIGGLREIIEPERGGWLVPPGDPVELAAAITAAFADAPRLADAARAARQRAAAFSIGAMAAQTEAFYRRLQ